MAYTVNSFAALLNCTPMDRASDTLVAADIKLYILVGWDFRLLHEPSELTDAFLMLQIFSS